MPTPSRDLVGHEPQGDEMFVLKIALGQGMRTPAEIDGAISQALAEYGASHNGTMTPFHVQPGYPQGHIHTADGVHVGDWAVTT